MYNTVFIEGPRTGKGDLLRDKFLMVALASLGEGESSMPDSICESDRWLISFSSLMIIYGKSLFHCSEVSRLGMEMEGNGGWEWRILYSRSVAFS